jgi:glycosyltransferase involved in cell wall biosynthesis
MSKSTDYTVIQLADFGAPYSGNFIASLLALDIVLKKKGFRQLLILPLRAKDRPWLAHLHKSNIPVYFLPDKMSPMLLAHQIAGMARNENVVVMHTHFTSFDVPAWLYMIFTRLKKISPKLIWHMHSYFPDEMNSSLIRRVKDILKFRIMGRSVGIIAVSEEIQHWFLARGFTGNSHVVLNCIDILKATQSNKSKIEIRRELRIPENKFLFLAFGWDPFRKGVDLLLEAFAKLSGETECVLLIIGGTKLKEFVAERLSGIRPSWICIDEPRECVADLYNTVDAFISASRWEGFSYAVGEAMANGLPVISSNIESLKWARPAEGVVFFDSGKVDSLIQAIKNVTLLSSQDLNDIKQSNRDFIEKNFHIDTWAQNICSIYEKIINNSKKLVNFRENPDN